MKAPKPRAQRVKVVCAGHPRRTLIIEQAAVNRGWIGPWERNNG
jgi:hypothetical protein